MFSKKTTWILGFVNKSSFFILNMSSLISSTFWLIFFWRFSQTGFNESFLFTTPLGRPTWEIIIIFDCLLIRKFMMGNADTIIKKNQKNACNVTGYCPYNMDNSVSLNSGEIVGEPIINSNNINGLKQKYLARHELESRMKAPYLSQEELLRGGFLNPN